MVHSIDYSQTLKLLMLTSTLLFAACSSSSDSSIPMNPATVDSNQNNAFPFMADSSAPSVTIDPIAPSVTPDPLTPSLTRVNFEITVPAYMSNSLAVDLTWGEQAIPVQWVGDELWSASGDLLSNTDNLLMITFYDENGAITLGNVETRFATGMRSAQTLQVSAEQFDTGVWDTDNDGISNFEESIAGSNPLVDENALLDVRESPDFSTIGIYSLDFYESQIPEQRPYFEHIDEVVDCCATRIFTIDIDEAGTGTYFREFIQTINFDRTTNRETGTRTASQNSIAWNGTSYRFNSGAAVGANREFDYTTTLLDGLQRGLVGSILLSSQGNFNPNDSIFEFSLIGEVIEGTQRCAPVSGTVSREYFRGGNTFLTATKAPGERYWRVSSRTGEEYFVNDIGTTFLCAFADWEL